MSSVWRRLHPVRGNTTGAQPPARARPGQLEIIVERRVRTLELRRNGATYREVSRQLGADLHTVQSDIQAKLLAIRTTTIEEARDLRALEVDRLDAMVRGLWRGIQEGLQNRSHRLAVGRR